MAKDVIMPVLGMNQEMGTLVEWFVAEGAEATKGEPLMLVATDKTEVEIEATTSGVLANITAHPGDEVAVGSTIAIILGEGESAPAKPAAASNSATKATAAPTEAKEATAQTQSGAAAASPVAARVAAEHNVDLSQISAKGSRIQKEDVLAHIAEQSQPAATNGRILASPKARRIAQENGVDLADIAGSGPDGAILTADVLNASSQPEAIAQTGQSVQESAAKQPSTLNVSRGWKVMAQRLQESWQTVPHFYLERDVDATALIAWQKQVQKRFEQKITVTDLLTKVVAAALRQHPRLNASWVDEQIVLNPKVNVGLAVAVEDGLMVPVVHQADEMGIGAIAERRAEIVGKALEGQLDLADMTGGTFTISNLGMFGITKFNAIVNPPQAAILAVGTIEDRVVAVKGKPKVRPMMTLTLSCDHRSVDGARGAQFMKTLAAFINDPMCLLD